VAVPAPAGVAAAAAVGVGVAAAAPAPPAARAAAAAPPPVTTEEHYTRSFVALGAARRMVSTTLLKALGTIDGTYIKIKGVAMDDDGRLTTVKGGCLLVLIGTDGDANLLPLAVGHVVGESEETWRWFITKCKEAFPALMQSEELMMSMDGDKGAKAAVEALLEQCGVVLCLKHRQRNIAAKFSGKAEVAEQCFAYFTKASQCLDRDDFDDVMREFERECPEGYRYIMTRPSETWATCMLKSTTFGKLTSNDAEGFNAMIASVKFMPIPALIRTCIETIVTRCYTKNMTTYLTKRASGAFKYDKYFGPRMTKVFDATIEKAQTLDVVRVGMTGGKVSSRSQLGRDHAVSIATPDDRSSLCACRRTAATSMVCSHVSALVTKIAEESADLDDDEPAAAAGMDAFDPRFYCDKRLTTQACREVYTAATAVPMTLPGTTGAWCRKAANDGLLAPQWLLDNIRADRAKALEQAAEAPAGAGAGAGAGGLLPRAGMPPRLRAGRGRGGRRGHGHIVSRGEREARAIQVSLSQGGGAGAGAPRGRYKCSICRTAGATHYDHTARNHATWAAGGGAAAAPGARAAPEVPAAPAGVGAAAAERPVVVPAAVPVVVRP
jgi:hypothetical protein